jgi:hypothetical protein
MTTTTWDLSIRDDLFALTHPEDGSEFTASVFYVIAEAPDGRRYAHEHRFYSAHVSCQVEPDGEYIGGIASYREKALAKAERFLAKVKAAQVAGRFVTPVDREHWYEIEPCYGSEAYCQQEVEIVADERAREALPF